MAPGKGCDARPALPADLGARLRVRLGVGRPTCPGVPGRARTDLRPADPAVAGRARPEPPFPIDDDTLFVAYFASAEIGCFLALGWPVPTRILDLYTEFRNATNGLPLPGGRGYLSALAEHGIASITKEQKTTERDLVIGGGPWTIDERRRILDYCQTDVDPLGALLERMLPGIRSRPNGLGQALLRGRYMAAVARMERTGVPIDVEMLQRLRTNWGRIKADLVAAIDKDYGVYEGTTFKAGLFAGYLVDNGIAWPRTESGRLALDRDTFRDMAKRYPQLEPLKELRHALSELRLEKLAVGPDDRNRTLLSPFGASSGRNTPSANKFIFGPAVWMRGLIKPAEGRALAYIDWSSARGLDRGAAVRRSGAAGRGAVGRSVSGVREDGRPGAAGRDQAVAQGDSGHVQDLRARHQLRDAGPEPGAADRAVGDRGAGPAAPAGADVPGVHRVGRARRRRRPADRPPVDGVRLDAADRQRRRGRRRCGTSRCRPTARRCCGWRAAWPPSAASMSARPCTTRCSSRAPPIGWTKRWRSLRRRWPRRHAIVLGGLEVPPTWRSSSGPTGTPTRAAT